MPKSQQPKPVRGMTEEGRAVDGLPIFPGDRFLTRFDTPTSPYPAKAHPRHASQWLIENAVAQARSVGDNFNARMFECERPMKSGDLPPASVAGMLMYLFAADFPVSRTSAIQTAICE